MSDGNQLFDRSDFYRDYSALKHWAGGEVVETIDRFSRTMGKLQLPPQATILEIGFGEGRFLDWARRHGYPIEGVEILPEMVEHARSRGHVAHLGAICQLEALGPRFDLIAAFDVIEHLTLPEILDLLQSAHSLLNTGGRIVLQFPNASSPFSGLYQAGDVTHQSILSEALLEQISRTKGWRVAQFFNARATSTRLLKRIKMSLAHVIRDFIELILSFAYYGARCPLDPNIIVVLERSRVSRSTEQLFTEATTSTT